MPTVVTRYLNTGSSGGDGTTNNTSGTDAAYATLEAARADIINDYASLVTSDVQVDLICSGATDDTTAVTNTWPTSDTTRYIHLQVPSADRLVAWDANVYTLSRNANFTPALTIGTNSMRMTGIQIAHTGNLNVAGNHGLSISSLGGELVLDGVKIIKLNNVGINGINVGASAGTYVFRNCLVGLRLSGSSFGYGTGIAFASTPSNSSVFIYNATVVRCGNAITVDFAASATNAVARVKNNLMQSCTNGISVTDATTDDQATNHHNTGFDASFVAETTGNCELTGADTVAREQGTDLSGVSDWPFSVDANDDARPFGSAWDIGAHECRAGAGARSFVAGFIG